MSEDTKYHEQDEPPNIRGFSAFDLDRLEAELADVTKQRDRLAGELDALKQSILDLSHPNMKLLLEERNEAREQIVANHKATLVIERMFYEVKEQRDRLAEALRSIRGYWNRNQNESAMVDACWHAIYTAEQALASVKGGSDDN
jgi:uncharacterized coiled-coil DUF342 family protein